MQRPGNRLTEDVDVTLARETVVLVRDLLETWINDTEGRTVEVPLTSMRDWHRLTAALERD